MLAGGVGLFIYSFTLYGLTTNETDSGIELQTLWLGDYYAPVEILEIEDEEQKTVLRLTPNSENAMLHTLVIDLGRNEFKGMYLKDYDIEGRDCEFRSGIEYTAYVKWPKQKAKTIFTLN
ncbi:hypothetical protein [Pelagicoccus sp. SDUM812005]|uniref:hypothetical protein n=1 Tax=Pelagicoccus sp. SDUM812005 TaxID=3041257 RepID=UPI0028107946|nr:hypothetical protein [Pelagicoccus sp. SDUM812005]MDQ8182716.1 hypothetical protein [Pelagicoccus sp. SDUM812005]